MTLHPFERGVGYAAFPGPPECGAGLVSRGSCTPPSQRQQHLSVQACVALLPPHTLANPQGRHDDAPYQPGHEAYAESHRAASQLGPQLQQPCFLLAQIALSAADGVLSLARHWLPLLSGEQKVAVGGDYLPVSG